jgi:hypothetical protein
MASFGIGILGYPALMLAASQFLRGVREDSYAAFGEDVFKSHIARQIYPETRALVEAHLRKGHTVAIVSSATPYQVAPAAKSLNLFSDSTDDLDLRERPRRRPASRSARVREPRCPLLRDVHSR